eukprot:767532_1
MTLLSIALSLLIEGQNGDIVQNLIWSRDCFTVEECRELSPWLNSRDLALENLDSLLRVNVPYCDSKPHCPIVNPLNMDVVDKLYEDLNIDDLIKAHYNQPTVCVDPIADVLKIDPIDIYIGDLMVLMLHDHVHTAVPIKYWVATINSFAPFGRYFDIGLTHIHESIPQEGPFHYHDGIEYAVYVLNRTVAASYFDAQDFDLFELDEPVLNRIGSLQFSLNSTSIDCALFNVFAQRAHALNQWFDRQQNIVYDVPMIQARIKESNFVGACLSSVGWLDVSYVSKYDDQTGSMTVSPQSTATQSFQALSGSLCTFKNGDKYILSHITPNGHFLLRKGISCLKEASKSRYSLFDREILDIYFAPMHNCTQSKGFEDADIEVELKADPTDCLLVEFDEEYPLTDGIQDDDRLKAIHDILKYIADHGEAPSPSKETKKKPPSKLQIDLFISEEEAQNIADTVYKKQLACLEVGGLFEILTKGSIVSQTIHHSHF